MKVRLALSIVGGLLWAVGLAAGAAPPPLTGSILGQVRNTSGVAQMGATVLLYDRYEHRAQRALTNEQGKFVFDALAPDLYSVRVSLASFMPAVRKNIAVLAGSESLLDISLASVFSTVELVYNAPGRGTLMTDDWKWVLRASQSTRPVLRFSPDISSSRTTSALFSETRGLVKVSAGDGESFAGGLQQDLGTAFALATSLFGSSRVQFAGNFGYASAAGIPAAGFRTTYSRPRTDMPSPEVSLTMRQLYLPNRAGVALLAGQQDSAPVLRTMSLGVLDRLQILDELRLEYGFSLESVSFLNRLNYLSPFARLTYDLGRMGSLRVAYSTGTQPTDLVTRGSEAEGELHQDLAALALLPQVSLRDGRARLQRTGNFEVGFQRVAGSRTYSAGMYHEAVSNAAFTMYAPEGFVPATELLPDLNSRSSVFNVGSYGRTGYSASLTQAVGEHFDISVAAGRGGALVADQRPFGAGDDEELRARIRGAQRSWFTTKVAGSLPYSGTRFATSYGWTDFRSLMPAHLFLAQMSSQHMGWNLFLRQPLPALGGLPGRLEASAELRNLLAQGYLPVVTADNRRALLVNTPRAVRGGLSFIF